MKLFTLFLIFLIFVSCKEESTLKKNQFANPVISVPFLVVLGTVQDAGSPHIACTKECCQSLFKNPVNSRKVVSLGVIDPENEKSYIFEATPDFPVQMKNLKRLSSFSDKETPDGIFLTHAHIGHYTGLMYLGKEAMNVKRVAVYAMPKLKYFLEQNGPWSQLVNINNILIHEIYDKQEIGLTSNLHITPFIVPHRDEYSETVGFTIRGPNKKALFIPDIDKWQKWDSNIIEQIAKVDYAFLDATFFDAHEINNRDISEIPHPFIIESMSLFKNLPASEKSKIYFIHFNHSNPVLNPQSSQSKLVQSKGFNIARMNDTFKL